MEGTKEFRMIINSVHIVIGLYLLSLTNGLDMIPLLPDTPEDYKKSEVHGYVLVALGSLAFNHIIRIMRNYKARGKSLKGYFENLTYWDVIHMVHLLVSGPLLILLGLSRLGKFDAIDQETFKSLSFKVGGGLILYHSVRMVMHSMEKS